MGGLEGIVGFCARQTFSGLLKSDEKDAAGIYWNLMGGFEGIAEFCARPTFWGLLKSDEKTPLGFIGI